MNQKQGYFYALLAFGTWGFVSIYWHAVSYVPLLEMVSYRILWSFFFIIFVHLYNKTFIKFFQLFKNPKIVALLIVTTLLIALNQGVYVYSIYSKKALEASLGYYINPLFNVILGILFLKEKLSKIQLLAILIAALGVLYFILSLGFIPWISFILALSFSLYGFIRKIIHVPPLLGMSVEFFLLTPFALFYLVFIQKDYVLSLNSSFQEILLLSFCGIMTIFPLIFYVKASKNLPFSTLGIFQYLSPSLQLLVAVFYLGESFLTAHFVTFSCIWFALGIFSFEKIKQSRKRIRN